MINQFLFAAALAAALLLSACGATSGGANANAARIASDINLISSGMAAALPALEKLPGFPAGMDAVIVADVAKIQADSAELQKALAANATTLPASPVQEIATILGDVATVVLPEIPGGAAAVPVVAAAQALLPELLAAAGIAAAPGTATMDPDAARLVLRAAGGV